MATLAAVCEATAWQPECTQDALDAGATDSFLASLPRGQTLQKPRPGALSRCVPARVCARPGASSRCVPARVRARPGVLSRCVPARVRARPGAQTGAPAGRLAAVSRVTAGQLGTFLVFCESFKMRESTCFRAAGTWRPRGAVRLVARTRSVAAARPGGGAACRDRDRLGRCSGSGSRSSVSEEPSSQGWGKVVAQYVHDQWACLAFLLEKHRAPASDAAWNPGSTLRSALDALGVLPAQQASPVLRCMKTLVPQVSTGAPSAAPAAGDRKGRSHASG